MRRPEKNGPGNFHGALGSKSSPCAMYEEFFHYQPCPNVQMCSLELGKYLPLLNAYVQGES